MKPLIRWTIGKTKSPFGWEVFSESIRLLPKVYPEFDFIICYNEVTLEEWMRLKFLGIPLYRQKRSEACFSVCWKEGKSVLGTSDVFAWKLVPVRLRPDGHELWVDNDIVICGKIPQIDEWLQSDTGLISEGRYPNYGRFADQIPESLKTCAGLFGLPPYFDFAEKIEQHCDGQAMSRKRCTVTVGPMLDQTLSTRSVHG